MVLAINVLPVPHLGRCFPIKVLMRSNMMIPECELTQCPVELIFTIHLPLIELLLQCAEESFYAPILPGAPAIDTLVPNPQ